MVEPIDKIGNGGHAALVQLQAYLAQIDLPSDGRLPPERELCDTLGVSRGDLRKALDVLARDGHIWRHVGKGTFVGSGPVEETIGILEIAGGFRVTDSRKALEHPPTGRPGVVHEYLG